MPGLCLRKIFPKVNCLTSDIPEKRNGIFSRKEDLNELPDDSTDVF